MLEDPRPESETGTVEHVEAKRAAAGTDLWPAIEAAQYAQVILCVQPRSDDERMVMAGFVEGFTRYVETWEELSPSGQASALEHLGRQIGELGEQDLHVHWGVTERTLEASADDDDRIPLAVVVVDGTHSPTAMVTVPMDIEVEADLEDDDDDDDEDEDGDDDERS